MLGSLVGPAAAHAQSAEGALLMETGRLTEVSTGHLGKSWCRAKFNTGGTPLVRCADEMGRPQRCEDTPGFVGLTMRLTDGRGFTQTYHWDPSQCDARALQYIFCHGPCEADGTGSCKATIRDYGRKLGPGWMDFKILPRNLTEIPAGPYVPPFTCEVEFDHGRRWAGSLDGKSCTSLAVPARMRCRHLESALPPPAPAH